MVLDFRRRVAGGIYRLAAYEYHASRLLSECSTGIELKSGYLGSCCRSDRA